MQAITPFVRLAIALGLTVTLAACATSPTGQSQLLLYSDQKMAKLGDKSYEQMLAEMERADSEANKRFVHCVVGALNRVTERDWRVTLFESDAVNAFAVPGGNIGIYSGLLNKATENAAQLAAVVAHEMGHVIAQHSNARMSRATVTGVGVSVLSIALGTQTSALSTGQIQNLLGMGAKVGILLPYTRSQEAEADRIGLKLMAAAGFDPRAAVELWRNMGKLGGKAPPELLSTHPSDKTRIQNLQQHMDRALTRYRSSPYNPQCEVP